MLRSLRASKDSKSPLFFFLPVGYLLRIALLSVDLGTFIPVGFFALYNTTITRVMMGYIMINYEKIFYQSITLLGSSGDGTKLQEHGNGSSVHFFVNNRVNTV